MRGKCRDMIQPKDRPTVYTAISIANGKATCDHVEGSSSEAAPNQFLWNMSRWMRRGPKGTMAARAMPSTRRATRLMAAPDELSRCPILEGLTSSLPGTTVYLSNRAGPVMIKKAYQDQSVGWITEQVELALPYPSHHVSIRASEQWSP